MRQDSVICAGAASRAIFPGWFQLSGHECFRGSGPVGSPIGKWPRAAFVEEKRNAGKEMLPVSFKPLLDFVFMHRP